MSENTPIRFFLGSNSPQGFVSRFDQLDCGDPQWHTFIIKGGPGCGKSTFMKRIASVFAERCASMQLIPCSSDPESLDAVILPEWKVSVVDGTAPHVLEPKNPALSESILSFGDFLDPMKIKPHGETIRLIGQATSKNYSQAIDCLAAAKSFLNDSSRIALSCLALEKLSAYARHYACKHFPRRSGHPGKGKESVRFLSAVNAQGVTSLAQTADALCSHICFIADDWGAASSLFLSALRTHALENGHDVITCYCPLSPHSKIDHLLIPGLGLAFMTENRFHNLSGLIPDRRIHAKRFLDIEVLRRHKKRLSFNQKAASQMIRQAVASLAENKALHDELESIYLQAMDFSMMDSVLESVVAQIVDFRTAREGSLLI